MRAVFLCALTICAAGLGAPGAWGQSQNAASKSTAAKKKPAKAPQQGLSAPAAKPLAPAQLFARGFEYYKAGRLVDAEELFVFGLRQNDSDTRAWEILARVQNALNKTSEAQSSLAEAVKKGMPQSQADALLQDFSYALPKGLPAVFDQCAAPQVRSALMKIPVPKSGRAYEARYTTKDSGGTFQFTPVPGGYDWRTVAGSGSFRNLQGLALAGLVSLDCQHDNRLLELNLDGQLFPIREGNKFVLEYEEKGSYLHSKRKLSCAAGDTRPAAEFTDFPWLKEGLATIFICTSHFVLTTKGEAPTSHSGGTKTLYFHRYGLFVGHHLYHRSPVGRVWLTYDVQLK